MLPELVLRHETPREWVDVVLGDLDSFLLDHASNERKASATAMSMLAHYPDRRELVLEMVELAREELVHFQQMLNLLDGRGLVLMRDEKDPYLKELRDRMRNGREEYFLDRLLLCGIVEARGCERFGLMARALPEGSLQEFYEQIAESEARHHELFVRLATLYFPTEAVEKRLNELLDVEGEILARLPHRAALH